MRVSTKLRPLRELRSACREMVATLLLTLMTTSLVTLPLPAADHASGQTPAARQDSIALSPLTQQNWSVPLAPDQKILQLLNRATFGPRPGDAERVKQMGLNAYLDQQLHPERITDSAVEARVTALPTLSMSTEELVENYPQPKKALKQEQRREESARQKKDRPADESTPAKLGNEMVQAKSAMNADMAEMPGPRRVIMELAQEEVLRSVYSNRQLQEVMVQFWMNHFNIFAPKGADRWLTTSFERDTIRPHALGKFEDLLVATAQSPAMLFYLDNWISSTPNPTYANERGPGWGPRPAPPFGMGGRGRYGIWRPFGGPFGGGPFGRGPFGPRPEIAKGNQAKPGGKQNKRGLNENYGRELMELHTMGVDGGYTQKDVIEVARCLTGWTIDRPNQGGGFVFRPQMHDFGEKVVLDHKISAGHGIEDGLQVLHILAHEPATAHFIALKLCRRFVADDPPQGLVDRAAHAFLRSDGDLRAVLKTILTSPEFYSQAAYRSKVKSPLELVASSIRALGADTDASLPLVQLIAQMGQPMFQYQAPTGFPDRASTWIDSSSLLMRMNFAMLLSSNHIRGTQVNWHGLSPEDGRASPETMLARLDQQLVESALSRQTEQAILKQSSGGIKPPAAEDSGLFDGESTPGKGPQKGKAQEPDFSTIAALVIASPEFQRR